MQLRLTSQLQHQGQVLIKTVIVIFPNFEDKMGRVEAKCQFGWSLLDPNLEEKNCVNFYI